MTDTHSIKIVIAPAEHVIRIIFKYFINLSDQ